MSRAEIGSHRKPYTGSTPFPPTPVGPKALVPNGDGAGERIATEGRPEVKPLHLGHTGPGDLGDLRDDVSGEERTGLAGLLDRVSELLAGWVAFPTPEARVAVTLWVAHTHTLDAFESTPRLALLSPEKGSGKTRCLEVLDLLVPTPMHAVNMSAAALFRQVADHAPTLLMDEADTYLGVRVAQQHEELRGLINAGHRRGAVAYRCVIEHGIKVVEFPAFCAVAIAGIGDLPDTILDRSVVIAMKRRSPDEQLHPFRERAARNLTEPVRDALTTWGETAVQVLEDLYPPMPEGVFDRAADVWEPLVAIADLAGDHWPEQARQACLMLNAQRAERDPSLGITLLADCRRVFDDVDTDRLATDDLLTALIALEESPWGDLRGQELDARGLARRLRPYDVRPTKSRGRKGYQRVDFHDAWKRYLPPPEDGPQGPSGPHDASPSTFDFAAEWAEGEPA